MADDEVKQRVASLLRSALVLDDRIELTDDTALLGGLPELDSLSLVALITALEHEFDFQVEDDELNAEVFGTFGTLVAFVSVKIAAAERTVCSRST